jgi:hypothetical protein
MEMRRLSVRSRGDGAFEVGPAGHGPTVVVNARDKRDALKRGKDKLRQRGQIEAAATASFRFSLGRIDTRRAVLV